MALNPSIILSGQTPDVMGGMARGLEVGQRKNEIQRGNALNAFMQENGPGVMQGDQAALEGLARFSPQAALGVQGERLGMDATRLGMDATRQTMAVQREELEVARRSAAQEAQAMARELSAEQAAAAQERLSGALTAMSTAQTPEQWDAYAQELGLTDYVGRFNDRDFLVARATGTLEGLGGGEEPASVQALRIRAQEAGLQPGTPEYQQFMVNGGRPPSGTSLEVDPNTGAVSFRQGEGVESGKPDSYTDAQSKNIIYYTRAQGALDTFEPIADALAQPGSAFADSIPGVGNFLVSEDYQRAEQAGREFLAAILRKDTGAAITADEMREYGQVFLPQPGDNPGTLRQKAATRQRALDALRGGMGAREILALAQSGVTEGGQGDGTPDQAGSPTEQTPAPSVDFSNMGYTELRDFDLSTATPEQIDAWLARKNELDGG